MDAPTQPTTQQRLVTRAKNKEEHPGKVTFSGRAKRRSRAEIEEEKRAQEEKKKEVESKQTAVIKRIAQMEDSMAIQDRLGRAHPRSRKDMHMEVDPIPSDGFSVPQQPKKKSTSKQGSIRPAPKPRGKISGKEGTSTVEDPVYADQSDAEADQSDAEELAEAPQAQKKKKNDIRNHKATSSRLEPVALDAEEITTEPDIGGKDSPVRRAIRRPLRRSNAVGLIEVAEPARESEADWEMADDSKAPKAKKKPTKPKTRELIKAASELKERECGSDDEVIEYMEVYEPEVNTTTAPNTGTGSEFNKIKNWTSHVAKTSRSSKSHSVYVPSGSVKSSSILVPSKRTTASSSAVVSKTHSQPEKKKLKLDNHNSTISGVLEPEEPEDEAVEREAALLSPTKGNQRLNSKAIVKVENMSPLPKRSGANRKYTNADLPNGAMNNNTWRKRVIPTYIQYLAGQDVKETWTIEDKDSVTLLQNIWNFAYGAQLPHTIKVTGAAFSIADQRICEWRAGIGSTAVAIIKAFIEDNHEEYDTDAACQTFATNTLNDFGFLYGKIEEKKGKIKRKNIFCGPFVIQTFTSHLNAIRGAQVITTVGPPGNATIALALSAAAVERVLTFWRDGHITLESIAEDKKGKGILRTVNGYTGKGTKTTDFNHANWRVATNAYLASIKTNLANGKLAWKDILTAAAEFSKSNVTGNEDSMAALGDAENERALLIPDSDSDSDS